MTLKQMFPIENWNSPECFKFAGVNGYAPMLAKELETEESQDKAFNDPKYIMEEKFDGTRALVHFFRAHDGCKNTYDEDKIVEVEDKQLPYIIFKITKQFSGDIKDMYYREHNEDEDADFRNRMNQLREFLIGNSYEYDDEGTHVTVECDTHGICVSYSHSSGAEMQSNYSYRDMQMVIDKLIEYDCYGEESGYCRVFSRRISKKTGFYAENTDSLPQIRDLSFPELDGTVLDGEMFIDGLPFKEVSSTLNCLWEEAVKRQKEKGFISFHAFDILFYKGIDIRRMPLIKRKKFLRLVVDKINSPYVKFVDYHQCGKDICISDYVDAHGMPEDVHKIICDRDMYETYPNFIAEYEKVMTTCMLSPRAFYEYITASGGEGVIVKPINGRYYHKRGWEYSKIKAFLTREMILIRFDTPTEDYTGKFPSPKVWDFWEDYEHSIYDLSYMSKEERDWWINNVWNDSEFAPVTKYYAKGQVGNMILGVLITTEEFNKISKNKRGVTHVPSEVLPSLKDFDHDCFIMEICDCGGFTDEDREYYTSNTNKIIGKVVEVKANGIMRDSGRLRHPRYLRFRPDKAPEECTWNDHIL